MAMIWIKSRFIGEESTAGGVKCELSKEPTWIIDPIGFHPHKSPKLLGVSYFQWWILTKRKMVKNITFRWDDQLHPQQPQHLHHPRLHGGKGQTSSSLNILIIRTIRIIHKLSFWFQQVEFCIVHNPIHDQTWTAQKGQGAFCDGKRIKVFFLSFPYVRGRLSFLHCHKFLELPK